MNVTGSSDSSVDYKDSLIRNSRILQLVLSTEKMVVGNRWNCSEDLGDMGHMKGTGTFLGYCSVDGKDCAVFSIIGILHIDLISMTKELIDDEVTGSTFNDTDISDSSINSIIYYDYEDGLIRWSETHQKLTITSPDVQREGNVTYPTEITTISSCRDKLHATVA
jgi:hypothetical protein